MGHLRMKGIVWLKRISVALADGPGLRLVGVEMHGSFK